MKTDTMILIALAMVAIYFVTKENTIMPDVHPMIPPPSTVGPSGDSIGA